MLKLVYLATQRMLRVLLRSPSSSIQDMEEGAFLKGVWVVNLFEHNTSGAAAKWLEVKLYKVAIFH